MAALTDENQGSHFLSPLIVGTAGMSNLCRRCSSLSPQLFFTLIAWTSLQSCPAIAEDNPFGLPAPHDKQRPGAIMLHGGGYGLADDIRREFVRLAGGKQARILLMPSDMCQRGRDSDGQPLCGGETIAAYERRLSQPREYGRWFALRESGAVADFQFLYRNDEDDPPGDKFYSLLESATGVWLPAYDQQWLPREFAANYPKKLSRFQSALREVVARGGVVGGLGGGMACLPETMIAGDHAPESGWVRANLEFGLALFNGVIVDQNFDARAGRLERLADLLRNGPRHDRLAPAPGVERRTIALGVERQTALVLCENTIRALGEGHGHVFLKGNGNRTITWRTIAPGEDPLLVQTSTAKLRNSATRSGDEPRRRERTDADNPFGLPEPIDSSRPGTVILHGGGQTDDIIELLPGLTDHVKPRLVHCPAARESCRPSEDCHGDALARRCEEIFSQWRQLQTAGRLESLSFVTTNDSTDADRAEFVHPLVEADALWFCGGDQSPLARLFVGAFEPTRFQTAVLDIVRRGGVVGGSSAGLAIMPAVMIEGGQPENGRPAEAELSRGLGVMQQALAEQHFDARRGRIERLTGLLRDHKRLANFLPTCDPKQMIGLAVEEDTALIAQANRLRVVGKQQAHVFLQETDPRIVTWHALSPGDAAVVRHGRRSYVLEIEEWEFSKQTEPVQ